MKYAVIIAHDKDRTALIKSDHFPRVNAVYTLAELHLAKVLPGATIHLSGNLRVNMAVGIHPERDRLIDQLRALNWPLPVGEQFLEGEYRVMK